MSVVDKSTLSQVGGLILIWLLTQEEGSGTRSKLGQALESLISEPKVVDEELAGLQRGGQIKFPRKGRQTLTASGRRAGLTALGIEALPRQLDWMTVKRHYLLARALDVRPPVTKAEAKPIETIDGLRAAILARHHGLSFNDFPTLMQVIDAFVWRALGVETRAPLTLDGLLKLLLRRGLSGEAVAFGVQPRTDAGPAPATGVVRAPNGGGAIELPQDEGGFAARVLAAARASKTGRFGDNKVFISHVIRRLADEGIQVGDTESFKARLVSAHRQRLLSLSRADLVEAMAPEDVDASETRYLSATFHFVRI